MTWKKLFVNATRCIMPQQQQVLGSIVTSLVIPTTPALHNLMNCFQIFAFFTDIIQLLIARQFYSIWLKTVKRYLEKKILDVSDVALSIITKNKMFAKSETFRNFSILRKHFPLISVGPHIGWQQPIKDRDCFFADWFSYSWFAWWSPQPCTTTSTLGGRRSWSVS